MERDMQVIDDDVTFYVNMLAGRWEYISTSVRLYEAAVDHLGMFLVNCPR